LGKQIAADSRELSAAVHQRRTAAGRTGKWDRGRLMIGDVRPSSADGGTPQPKKYAVSSRVASQLPTIANHPRSARPMRHAGSLLPREFVDCEPSLGHGLDASLAPASRALCLLLSAAVFCTRPSPFCCSPSSFCRPPSSSAVHGRRSPEPFRGGNRRGRRCRFERGHERSADGHRRRRRTVVAARLP
jgi:hypothetical protein